MRGLIFSLLVLCCSSAFAQGYVPIEQSRSYWAPSRYMGPVYPSYGGGYYGGYYYQPVIRVQVSQDPLDPLFPSSNPRSSFYYGRRGW